MSKKDDVFYYYLYTKYKQHNIKLSFIVDNSKKDDMITIEFTEINNKKNGTRLFININKTCDIQYYYDIHINNNDIIDLSIKLCKILGVRKIITQYEKLVLYHYKNKVKTLPIDIFTYNLVMYKKDFFIRNHFTPKNKKLYKKQLIFLTITKDDLFKKIHKFKDIVNQEKKNKHILAIQKLKNKYGEDGCKEVIKTKIQKYDIVLNYLDKYKSDFLYLIIKTILRKINIKKKDKLFFRSLFEVLNDFYSYGEVIVKLKNKLKYINTRIFVKSI